MLRRINVVENEEAAAIWYVKKDKCGFKMKKQLLDLLRRI